MKPKVKCGDKYPTELHLRLPDGRFRKNGGRIEDLNYGASLVPILSATYGLWFLGGGLQFGLSWQLEEAIVTPGVDTSDDSTPLASAPRRERRRRRAAPRARTTLVDSSREGEANRASATREGRRRPSARPRRRGLHWRDEDSRERRARRRRREA